MWQLGEVTKTNESLERVIQKYFEAKTNVLSVAISLEHFREWRRLIEYYLTEAFRIKDSMKFEIFNDGKKRKHQIFNYNLWYVDSYKAFCSLLPDIAEHQFVEKMGRYMVIMKIDKHLNNIEELQLILEKAYKRNIVDITVALYEGNFSFNLYTYNIFQPQKCRQVVRHQFNTFRRGDLTHVTLFPKKLQDFHKCPIDIFLLTSAKFFDFNRPGNQRNIAHFWDVEAKILRLMAQKLNFELRLQQSKGEPAGTVYGNGSYTGPFQSLAERKFDVLMGYYHFPFRARYFAATTTYFQMPMVIVIPKRTREIPNALWLMAPFGKRLWFVIALVVTFGTTLVPLVRYIFNQRNVLRITWLDALGLTIGHSRSIRYCIISTRYFVIVWSFGFLVIWGTFQGKLYAAFNSKPQADPILIPQLIADNYTFLFKQDSQDDLVRALTIPPQQIVYNEFPNDDDVYESMLHDSHHPRAALTNYWEFRAFIGSRRLYDEYEIVPRIIVMNQLCAYLRPQSLLMEPLDGIIDALHAGGILNKWLFDLAGNLGVSYKVEMASSLKPLSLTTLQIVFLGLLVMHSLSLLVFLGEILFKKITDKRS